MNDETTQLTIRERPAALIPASIEQAVQLAKIMSDNSLVPQHLRGKPNDCFMVIEVAARWGMSPFAVAQCTSIISGKLMYEGKLVAAVVNARGELAVRLNYRFEGEGERLKCFPFGTLRGEDKPREIPEGVELAKVRTTNDMWRKQPHQQLTYAAARIWARRHLPEVMLGVYSDDEEIEPYQPPTPLSDIQKANAEWATPTPKAPAPPAIPVSSGGGGPASSTVPAATAVTTPANAATDASSAADAESPTHNEHDPKPGEFRDQVECFVWKWYAGREPTKPERAAAGGDVGKLGEWISLGAEGMEPQRSLGQNNMLHALRQQRGIDDPAWRERLARYYNKTSSADLSVAEASDLIDRLQKAIAQHGTAAQKQERQQRRLADASREIDDFIRGPSGGGQ